MSVSTDDRTADRPLRCPTCGARQAWSDTCRRCTCDLSLLRRVAEAADARRCRALLLLREGRAAEALRHAQRAYALRPEPRFARLVAVCYLHCGNWIMAAAMARFAGDQP